MFSRIDLKHYFTFNEKQKDNQKIIDLIKKIIIKKSQECVY